MTPHVMKRDGCKVPFNSYRIKAALLRAAIAAGIEDILSEFTYGKHLSSDDYRLVGIKRDKKRVVFFVFKYGLLKRLVLSANSMLRKQSILDVLSTATVIYLLKASRRLARSPPLSALTNRCNALKINRVKFNCVL